MPKGITKPFEAYQGTDPYLFVSYAHADMEEVYRDIADLHAMGCRIWYDEGISAGKEWAAEIQKRIEGCAHFVVFLSPHAVDSSTVRAETNVALDEQKQFVAVHLVETQLLHGLKIRIGNKQHLSKYEFESQETYVAALRAALPNGLFSESEVVIYPPDSPEADLVREIQFLIGRDHGWSNALEREVMETGELLGLTAEKAKDVLHSTLERLGVGEEYGAHVEVFRKLVAHYLESGGISGPRRVVLQNRASILKLLPEHWEIIVQEESARLARRLVLAGGNPQEARSLLVASVGSHAAQLPEVRLLLEELERPVAVQSGGKSPHGVDECQASSVLANRATTTILGGISIPWVKIPAGMFLRGCPDEFFRHAERSYGKGRVDVFRTYPERREPLDTFWIARTPITNEQFLAFVKATTHRYPAGWNQSTLPFTSSAAHKPVTGVTWKDAVEFADWLGARLPSRAEYEKACRGTEGLIYPWGNQFDPSRCNTAESGRGELTECDAFPPGASSFGVLDLVGNVWEWALDASTARSDFRMTVGASYEATGEIFGAGFFDVSRPSESSDNDLGFRIACTDMRKLIVENLEFSQEGMDSGSA